MRITATRGALRVAAILTVVAGVRAQTPEITLPFYGTYAVGSPELSNPSYPGFSAADILYRQPSTGGPTAPVLRGDGALLFGAAGIPESMIELAAIGYLNDVFSAWGPWSELPTGVNVRKSTIGFTVAPGSTVMRRSNPTIPASMCAGAPASAQVFQSVVRTQRSDPGPGQSWIANDAAATTCGLADAGSPTSMQSVIGSLAIEPNALSNGGIPVYFVLSRNSCDAINAAYFNAEPVVRPSTIYYAAGNGAAYVAWDGQSLGILKPGDAIDAVGGGNGGNFIFSLDTPSTTVQDQNTFVSAIYRDATNAVVCRSVVVDQNTLIGFVPATAAQFVPGLALPNIAGCGAPVVPYDWDLPFLWFDPVELGLDSISDNLNGLEVSDPPTADGIAGNMPLRGGPGEAPQQRLSLFAQGVAGDGGAVVPVPVMEQKAITISVRLAGVPTPETKLWWILWGNIGRANEFTWQEVSVPLFDPFRLFFDFGAPTTIPIAGSCPPSGSLSYSMGAAGYVGWGNFDADLEIPDGLPCIPGLDSLTLQATLVVPTSPGSTNPYKMYTSNCVELNVYPEGAPVVPLGQVPVPVSFP